MAWSHHGLLLQPATSALPCLTASLLVRLRRAGLPGKGEGGRGAVRVAVPSGGEGGCAARRRGEPCTRA